MAKRTNKNIIIIQKTSNPFSLLLNVFYLSLPYYSCFLERGILPLMYQPHIEMAFLPFKEKAFLIINEIGMIANVPDIVTD